MAQSKSSTQKKSAAKRPPARRPSRRRPQPDIAQSWSILLFGVGAVLVTMIFVQGESLWAWLRSALFGVFGLGMYVLGALVLYVAVLVALAKPIWGKCAKTLLLMMFVCGTAVVFSHTELADHTFWETVKLLYEQGQGALGGGVLGGVVGGSLLVLCGRPAANILLVVLLGAATMWFAGVTPGDLWQMAERYLGDWKEDREAARAERLAFEEEQAKNAPPAAPEPAPAPKRRGRKPQVDIELGPEPVAEIDLAPEPEEPLVGPGGTFGM